MIEKLNVSNLDYGYDDRLVLSGVSFTLDRAEALLVTGPNGAGKTTLLRCLARLLRPKSGMIAFEPALPEQDLKRFVGLLDHEPLVSEDLTIEENLLVFARLYHLPEPAGKVREVMGRAGLAAIGPRITRECSSGQIRRLAVARTVIHAPDVLLLDEPAVGLDEEGRSWLERILREHREGGGLAVIASHEPAAFEKIVTHCGVLDQGRFTARRSDGP